MQKRQSTWLKRALATAAVAVLPVSLVIRAHSSDHADTPTIAASPGVDLTDVYVFNSPTDPNNVVLVMNSHPLIPSGQGQNTVFDPNVLYQFKIDNTGDNVEDLVIQARFIGTDPLTQRALIYGPGAPKMTGTSSSLLDTPLLASPYLNTTDTTPEGVKVFCGGREDPFFFDLERFFAIFPDRATPLTGTGVAVAQANIPQVVGWRTPGIDYLAGYNVMSIVIELPKARLFPAGHALGRIGVWCTTSK